MEGGKNWMAPGDPLQDCWRLRATLGPEHVEERLTGRALGQLRPADAVGPPSLPPHVVFEALIIQALLAVRRGPGGPSRQSARDVKDPGPRPHRHITASCREGPGRRPQQNDSRRARPRFGKHSRAAPQAPPAFRAARRGVESNAERQRHDHAGLLN